MLTPSKSKQTVRASAVLTGAYVAGTVLSVEEHNFLGILVKYTKGDETSLQVKVEASIDGGTTYGQQVTENTTGGTITVTTGERTFSATGNYLLVISPLKADKIKISAKATGGTPTGTLEVQTITGWA